MKCNYPLCQILFYGISFAILQYYFDNNYQDEQDEDNQPQFNRFQRNRGS